MLRGLDCKNIQVNAKSALKATIYAAISLLVLVTILAFIIETNRGVSSISRIQFYKLYLDAFKAILISGLVALVSVLIPQVLAQAKADFEKRKESRLSYSQAKTGLDYLPVRLCGSDLREAASLIQRVHVHKHQAQLYTELERWLANNEKKETPAQWGERMYNRLRALRNVLEENAGAWDNLSHAQRLRLLNQVVPKDAD